MFAVITAILRIIGDVLPCQRLYVDNFKAILSGITIVRRPADCLFNLIRSLQFRLGEQRDASQDLARNMERVTHMAEENSASVEKLASTSSQLMGLSNNLRGVVARFQL